MQTRGTAEFYITGRLDGDRWQCTLEHHPNDISTDNVIAGRPAATEHFTAA